MDKVQAVLPCPAKRQLLEQSKYWLDPSYFAKHCEHLQPRIQLGLLVVENDTTGSAGKAHRILLVIKWI
jgi:hypothetical protein